MEIQNEIVKTKKRIDLLEHQNDKFKSLLEKALTVTRKTSVKSTLFENDFLQESIDLIEKEKENLKNDLSSLSIYEDNVTTTSSVVEGINNLERLCRKQQEEIDHLKAEHEEIKFLLLHPESRNSEWLRNILQLDSEVPEPCNGSLIEERFRLQRKILNLEKKKAELLLAINDAAIPINMESLLSLRETVNLKDEDRMAEYQDLRFKMLNLEDDRSRLLNDLQCVLDRSRKEITEEYNNLQAKIMEVEKQKACLSLRPKAPHLEGISNKELERIFSAFRNLPLNKTEEQARIERLKSEVGSMFCPGINLPLYCNIL